MEGHRDKAPIHIGVLQKNDLLFFIFLDTRFCRYLHWRLVRASGIDPLLAQTHHELYPDNFFTDEMKLVSSSFLLAGCTNSNILTASMQSRASYPK
jgi:hypothetical protein